jgi:hypothetical protein
VINDVFKITKIILILQLTILIRFSPIECPELSFLQNKMPLTDISGTQTAASGAQKSTPKHLSLGTNHCLLHVHTHANPNKQILVHYPEVI